MAECVRDHCSREVLAKGLCASHYNGEKAAAKRAAARAVERPCLQCGSSIAGKRLNAKYCDAACKQAYVSAKQAAEYRRRRSAQVCRWCGGPIPMDAGNRALACSPKCGDDYANHVAGVNARKRAARRAAWDANRPDCIGCGIRIPDERPVGVKYCSTACKRREHSARWREKSPGYMRQYLYGMTAEDYAALLEQQGNACAICEGEWTNGRPHVDHDHSTGKVRGLLCGPCNTGLGHFRDDVALLRKAVRYLT